MTTLWFLCILLAVDPAYACFDWSYRTYEQCEREENRAFRELKLVRPWWAVCRSQTRKEDPDGRPVS